MSDPGGRELVVAMRWGGDAGEIYKVKPTEPDAGPDGGGSKADVEPPPVFLPGGTGGTNQEMRRVGRTRCEERGVGLREDRLNPMCL